MEQFSLEKYLADPTRKVVTRDGRDVRIICTDSKTAKGGYDIPIVALAVCRDGSEELYATTSNGEISIHKNSDTDLFFAPQKQSRWVFLYRTLIYGEIYSSNAFSTKEEAEREMKALSGFALTEINWEE